MLSKIVDRFFGVKPVDPPQPVADAPFAYEFVKGDEVGFRLLNTRNIGKGIPVLAGSPDRFPQMFELMEMREDTEKDVLETGLSLDVDAWLRQAQLNHGGPDGYAGYKDAVGGVALTGAPKGLTSLTVHLDRSAPMPWAVLAYIPVRESWEVPAHIAYGGWNDCPESAVHVAFFKRWFDRYGAVVASVTFDVVEFTVERPPRTMEEATALAMEQFLYCPDNVLQGAGNVANLAKMLLGARYWYFWWD